jgi:tRNA A37 threonylcarbamoyladenosine dehydratase
MRAPALVASGVAIGVAATILLNHWLSQKRRESAALPPFSAPAAPSTLPSASMEAEILAEQLSRTRSYFDEAGASHRVECAFVVVVGLGGVGSHAAAALARNGVGSAPGGGLRLIDFDNVTLSSLNRHATATRDDVGTPKAEALVRALRRVVPGCALEPVVAMFTAAAAPALLRGAAFVLDCIDNRDTKLELLLYCRAQGIPLLASMGAGGKQDPTRLRVADLALVPSGRVEPLAAALKMELRRAGAFAAQCREGGEGSGGSGSGAEAPPALAGIACLYSCEEPRASLLPLPEGVPLARAKAELGAVEGFRMRVIPVLGTMPAMFGQAMAAHALCALAGGKHVPAPLEAAPVRGGSVTRLCAGWTAWEEAHYPRGDYGWGASGALAPEEVQFLLDEAWHARSAVSHLRLGARGVKLQLTRWRPWAPSIPSNLVLVTDEEATALAAAVEVEEVWAPAREAVAAGGDFNSGRGVPRALAAAAEAAWAPRARAAMGGDAFERIEARLEWVRAGFR